MGWRSVQTRQAAWGRYPTSTGGGQKGTTFVSGPQPTPTHEPPGRADRAALCELTSQHRNVVTRHQRFHGARLLQCPCLTLLLGVPCCQRPVRRRGGHVTWRGRRRQTSSVAVERHHEYALDLLKLGREQVLTGHSLSSLLTGHSLSSLLRCTCPVPVTGAQSVPKDRGDAGPSAPLLPTV